MVGKNLLNSIEVTTLALLERARAWEWVMDPLFARGGQGSRKNSLVITKYNRPFVAILAIKMYDHGKRQYYTARGR